MWKDYDTFWEKSLEKIVTPEFLEAVEKWARYKGEDFSIGDADIYVKNKGQFVRTTMIPAMIRGANGIEFEFKNMKPHHTYYDVTLISDSATCSHYSRYLLVAQAERFSGDEAMWNPSELYIFPIKGENDEQLKVGYLPTFEEVKNNFENRGYTAKYQSLIHNFCNTYKLVGFNEVSDRIRTFSVVYNNLYQLQHDEKALEFGKGIKAVKRLNKKGRDAAYNRHMAKLQEQIKKQAK